MLLFYGELVMLLQSLKSTCATLVLTCLNHGEEWDGFLPVICIFPPAQHTSFGKLFVNLKVKLINVNRCSAQIPQNLPSIFDIYRENVTEPVYLGGRHSFYILLILGLSFCSCTAQYLCKVR